ncbi:MAG: SCP2 sterol-binding domain-containing protein [Actinomycetota bacterium]|nr:SCP2 sterol-binding domain-containing protein [Actinomycetota bacterium]
MPAPAPVARVDWREAAAALADEVARVTTLLRTIHDGSVPALGQWSIAEVAMHLSQAWMVVTGLAEDDLSNAHRVFPTARGSGGVSLIREMWDLSEVTMAGVRADPERNLGVVADRIDERAGAFLGGLGPKSAEGHHAWLVEGVIVSLPTLVCHLLNETMVHGYDIACAAGRRWAISRPRAALILDGFLVPVLASLPPRTMVDQQKARGRRITYELRVRGAQRHLFVFDDGELLIEPPGARPVDCHISADPAAMLLVAWARRSQWSAIAQGQLVAWGRKPWLGPRLRILVRNP